MATFIYEAVDRNGNTIKAQIEALNESDAKHKIRTRDYYPTRVLALAGAAAAPAPVARPRRSFSLNMSISLKSLTHATRQFATMLDAGLPITRSLDILTAQQEPGLLKKTLSGVNAEVKGGAALSEALARHPRVFDPLYVNMVKAGETGGVLDQILVRLADHMEKTSKLKQKVISALVYPATVVAVAGGILTFILVFIIRNATGNTVIAGAIGRAHDSIREGETIAGSLRHSSVFDALVVNMIAVGEEKGVLDKMLIRVADTYDSEVDTMVGTLTTLLEPVLVIGMGGAVGFIVIALFLPLVPISRLGR